MLAPTSEIHWNYANNFEYLNNFDIIYSFPFYSMLILLTKLILWFTNSHIANKSFIVRKRYTHFYSRNKLLRITEIFPLPTTYLAPMHLMEYCQQDILFFCLLKYLMSTYQVLSTDQSSVNIARNHIKALPHGVIFWLGKINNDQINRLISVVSEG
jgi:hypothetical protein